MKTSPKVLIEDKRGRNLYAQVTPVCMQCLEKCQSTNEVVRTCSVGGTHRRGAVVTDLGAVYICSDDRDEIASSKLFKRQISFYSEMLQEYLGIRDEMHKEGVKFVKRLIHNITSLNAHHLQDLYLLVPQDSLTGTTSGKNQLDVVESALKNNRKDLAAGYLRLLKNAIAIKSEINVFRNLYSEKNELRPKYHYIHKVIRNVSSIYFQEFQNKSIQVTQDKCEAELLFDYESFSVALHHLFQNAVKYSKHDSMLSIKYVLELDTFQIVLEMTSLTIHPGEIELIFEDGYSGAEARASELAGDGSGMGIAKKLLELNGATLKAIAGASGSKYAHNKFCIGFQSKKMRKQRADQ